MPLMLVQTTSLVVNLSPRRKSFNSHYLTRPVVSVSEGGEGLHRPPHAGGDGDVARVLHVVLDVVQEAPEHQHAHAHKHEQQAQVLPACSHRVRHSLEAH